MKANTIQRTCKNTNMAGDPNTEPYFLYNNINNPNNIMRTLNMMAMVAIVTITSSNLLVHYDTLLILKLLA